MLNRHGLIAGATGTGKTRTLQLMAEQLSAIGVPVFAADIKGDLTGLSPSERAGHPADGACDHTEGRACTAATPGTRHGRRRGAVVSSLKSRQGRSMINTVARGVFGLLKKR